MRKVIFVAFALLAAIPTEAAQKRDIVGLSPGMSIPQLGPAMKQFGADLAEQEGVMRCDRIDGIIRRFQELQAANKLDQFYGLNKIACGGRDRQNPKTATRIEILFTREYKFGTTYEVDLFFEAEGSSQQIVQQVSDQFGAKADRILVEDPAMPKFAVFRWNLGDGLGLVLLPSCYSRYGKSSSVDDCQQAPASESNNYRLSLFDTKLVNLEQQAHQKALPRINPKPKF